jgi:hypothetical protein
VTISAMRLVAAAVVAAAVVPGCGSGSGSDDAALRRADEARAAAARSLDAVEGLQDDVDSLTHRLADARAKDAALGHRLDSISERLWDSLGRLRSSIDDASSSASSALGAAQSAARDIAVLEQRLDYHLRQGGG